MRRHAKSAKGKAKMQTDKTVVIFRKFTGGADIIAMFPELPGTNCFGTCLSYQHVGQHGAASVDLSHCTESAKPEEYGDLLEELRRLGYTLSIRKRCTAAMAAKRREALKPYGPQVPPNQNGLSKT